MKHKAMQISFMYEPFHQPFYFFSADAYEVWGYASLSWMWILDRLLRIPLFLVFIYKFTIRWNEFILLHNGTLTMFGELLRAKACTATTFQKTFARKSITFSVKRFRRNHNSSIKQLKNWKLKIFHQSLTRLAVFLPVCSDSEYCTYTGKQPQYMNGPMCFSCVALFDIMALIMRKLFNIRLCVWRNVVVLKFATESFKSFLFYAIALFTCRCVLTRVSLI